MIKPKLRDSLLLALAGTFLTLIVSYSVIAGSYFLNGFDTLTKTIMRELYREYADQIDQQRPIEQPRLLGFQVAANIHDLPAVFQWQLQGSKLPYDVLKVMRLPPRAKEAPAILFLMKMQTPQGRDIFLLRLVDPNRDNRQTSREISDEMQRLIIIGIGALLLSLLILVLLYRTVASPLRQLTRWTRALHSDTLMQPHPDFRYSEINGLADLVQNSLHSAQRALEREHNFLRHASHELRTPLSIISTNLQLLQRFRPPDDLISRQVLERIDRATANMSQLTETLLWLNRDEASPIAPEPVQLDELLYEMIEAHRHLLANKEVRLATQLRRCTLQLPATPSRIIIGNLIRNACQHTHSGTIRISLSPWGELDIRNDAARAAVPDEQADGFGLGLNLVAQLAQRFGWTFSSKQEADNWHSHLQFTRIDSVETSAAHEQH